MSIIDDIRELKSNNNLEGAWQAGYQVLQQDKHNEFLKSSLFWVIYAALKLIAEPIKSRKDNTPRPSEQQAIDLWASRIFDLELTLPSDNFDFRLWNLFNKIGKFCEPICSFILMSGSKLFHADDHKPFVTDKGESPSTVQKLARMVAACYLLKGEGSTLSAPRIVAFLKYAEEVAEDSPAGKVWLAYDKAKIYLQADELQKARDAYLTVLQRKRNESWAWFGLAKTYEDEPYVAIKLLANGLSSAHDPKFSTQGLFQIAERFHEIGENENASKALSKLLEIYSQNGWTPRDNILALTSSPWFDASVDYSDLDAITRSLSAGAEQYTIANPQRYAGILQNVHASLKGANIYVSRDLTLSARKGVFPKRNFPEPGTPLEVLCDLSSDKPEVVSVKVSDHFESPDIRLFDGTLSVTDRGFGFVNGDIFVYASLASTQPDNCQTKGVAVAAFDKAKNKYGWRAISLHSKDG
ncbi:hypothetical protein SAMN04487867_10655 [Vreelandella titanicae]|uniref:tetratricopeptide repeat protein n=1 Tax=Vreelandella titanicae TaxID=664683 RepID=UPI00087EA32F|nr:tetratricopeptide repeat protein [Halomonas titanicae]SDI41740.1 hypothetical protein SAMN04487867_10655 [Halomonas titanicae]